MDSTKTTILFCATYPTQTNGYSKIANKLSNFLAATPDYKVYYFGFSNFENSRISRFVHPNITFIDVVDEEKRRGNKELYGVNIFQDTIKQIDPDIVLFYNDIIVCCRLINCIIEYRKTFTQRFKLHIYLDLVYEFEKPDLLDHVIHYSDKIYVFSDFWEKHLIEYGAQPEKLQILYHGFNNDIFQVKDKITSRKNLDFDINDFIILNLNTNCYRKANDISIRAFLMFLKKMSFDKTIKFVLQCDLNTKSGYNLRNVIFIECIRLGISKEQYDQICNTNIIYVYKPIREMSDSVINDLYNATDIGINSCIGEGFGLCNLEHAILEKPQIISHVGALQDIFDINVYPKELIVKPKVSIHISNCLEEHTGIMHICDATDFYNSICHVYENYAIYQEFMKTYSLKLRRKYDWGSIISSKTQYLDWLKVYHFDNKIRVGEYVIADIPENYDCYITFWGKYKDTFSKEFKSKYNPQEAIIFNDEQEQDFYQVLNTRSKVFLKMIITDEYDWLSSFETTQLQCFSQIIIELHNLFQNDLIIKHSCMQKLTETHYLIHAHGNNRSFWNEKIPNVIELTFLNKKYFTEPPPLNTHFLPGPLDKPNNPEFPDVALNYYPFVQNFSL